MALKLTHLITTSTIKFSSTRFNHSQAAYLNNHSPEINHPELDFNETTDSLLKTNSPFKYNEFIVCKTIQRNSGMGKHDYPKVRNKLIQLKPGEITRYAPVDIWHDHIIERSMRNNTRDVEFKFLTNTVSFSRPTLYEYIALKEQTAVPSHYSIISLVPMLLDLGRHSRVLECGTGSGAMTLFLSERLGNSGMIHSFDIGHTKCQKAKSYFHNWKSSYDLSGDTWPSNVKFGVRNLCEQNFDKSFNEFYDAIYLDMAEIDRAMHNAYKVLKLNGVIVINALHLTQVLRLLNVIKDHGLGLEQEILLEPANRVWEIRRILRNKGLDLAMSSDGVAVDSKASVGRNDGPMDWTCRLEDRFDEKFKRGGLFYNYWSGYLVKLRKIK